MKKLGFLFSVVISQMNKARVCKTMWYLEKQSYSNDLIAVCLGAFGVKPVWVFAGYICEEPCCGITDTFG